MHFARSCRTDEAPLKVVVNSVAAVESLAESRMYSASSVNLQILKKDSQKVMCETKVYEIRDRLFSYTRIFVRARYVSQRNVRYAGLELGEMKSDHPSPNPSNRIVNRAQAGNRSMRRAITSSLATRSALFRSCFRASLPQIRL